MSTEMNLQADIEKVFGEVLKCAPDVQHAFRRIGCAASLYRASSPAAVPEGALPPLPTEKLLRLIAENTGRRINLSLDDLDQYLSVARAAVEADRAQRPQALLPQPDTHCWDDDTQSDVWSYSKGLVQQILQAAVSADRAQQGEPVAVKYGCHCDLVPHMEPDGCVIDSDRREDCVYARRHASKETCEYWQPIKVIATKAAAPACPTCKGNDMDAPCAYPSQGKPGCLRDARLAAAPADASLFADEATRLRRVVNLLDLQHAVPGNDASLRECLFSVLGLIARELEQRAAPAPDTGIPTKEKPE